jgi:hypothetical protein
VVKEQDTQGEARPREMCIAAYDDRVASEYDFLIRPYSLRPLAIKEFIEVVVSCVDCTARRNMPS